MLREQAAAQPLFGAQNICRRLVEIAMERGSAPFIVWPETLGSSRVRNANELLWHGMAAQVQLIFGIATGKLDPENVYFAKGRRGFVGALRHAGLRAANALSLRCAARGLIPGL